jgi:hypothetical protein
MAKAKKAKKAKKKTKVRDLKARKTVKGGSKIARPIPGDPCDGGEFSGKIG